MGDARIENLPTVDGAFALEKDSHKERACEAAGQPRDKTHRVRFQVCGWTSQDGLCPAEALESDQNESVDQDFRGWCTEAFCAWPQEIELAFASCTRIDEIEILAHSYRTPHSIDVFITGFQKDGGPYYVGRLDFDSNLLQDHTLNECKRASVDAYGTGLLLRITKCYSNRFNLFEQANLLSVRVFGSPAQDLLLESPAPRPRPAALDTDFRSGARRNPEAFDIRRRRRFEVVQECELVESGYDHSQMTEVDRALLSIGVSVDVVNTTATPFRVSQSTANQIEPLQERIDALFALEEEAANGTLTISCADLLEAVGRLQATVDKMLELGTALTRLEAMLLAQEDSVDVQECNRLRKDIDRVAGAALTQFDALYGERVPLEKSPSEDNRAPQIAPCEDAKAVSLSPEETPALDVMREPVMEEIDKLVLEDFKSPEPSHDDVDLPSQAAETRLDDRESKTPSEEVETKTPSEEVETKTPSEEAKFDHEEAKTDEEVTEVNGEEAKTGEDRDATLSRVTDDNAQEKSDEKEVANTGRSASPRRGLMGRLWPRSPREGKSPTSPREDKDSNLPSKTKDSSRSLHEQKDPDGEADAFKSPASPQEDKSPTSPREKKSPTSPREKKSSTSPREDKSPTSPQENKDSNLPSTTKDSSRSLREQKDPDGEDDASKSPPRNEVSQTSQVEIDEKPLNFPEGKEDPPEDRPSSPDEENDPSETVTASSDTDSKEDPLQVCLQALLAERGLEVPKVDAGSSAAVKAFGPLVQSCFAAGTPERTAALEAIGSTLRELVPARISGKEILELVREILVESATVDELHALDAVLRVWYLLEEAKEEPFHEKIVYQVLAHECCTSRSNEVHEFAFALLEYLCNQVPWVISTSLSQRLLDELRTRPKPDPVSGRYERVLRLVHEGFENARDDMSQGLPEETWERLDNFFAQPPAPHSAAEQQYLKEAQERLEKLRNTVVERPDAETKASEGAEAEDLAKDLPQPSAQTEKAKMERAKSSACIIS